MYYRILFVLTLNNVLGLLQNFLFREDDISFLQSVSSIYVRYNLCAPNILYESDESVDGNSHMSMTDRMKLYMHRI
jgi:hypothetical protein